MLLAATLRVPRGSAWFTILGLLVAATWTVGSIVSGPIPLQSDRDVVWRTFVGSVVGGASVFGAFVSAYLVARHLPLVGPALDGVLATADAGPTALVLFVALVNGAGEELFFRRRAPRRIRTTPSCHRHDHRVRRRHRGHRQRRPRHRRRRDGRPVQP